MLILAFLIKKQFFLLKRFNKLIFYPNNSNDIYEILEVFFYQRINRKIDMNLVCRINIYLLKSFNMSTNSPLTVIIKALFSI
jgi:hypothetical protein